MAKRNYEALNAQLIEELPHFIHLAQKMIDHTVTVLTQLQYKLHTAIHTVLERLVDELPGGGGREASGLSSEVIRDTHSKALAEVAGRLIALSIVPASLAMSLPAAAVRTQQRRVSEGGGGGGRQSEREDSILSTSSEVDMDSSITEVLYTYSHHSQGRGIYI